MTITLELEPEMEAGLMAQAMAQGTSVEAYVKSLIQNALTINQKKPLPHIATQEDWEATLQELGKSPSLAKVPPLSEETLTRESIYSNFQVIEPQTTVS